MKGIKKYKLFMTLIKSKFTNNFFYFGIIYFKDLQKVKYTLKQLLRNTLIVKNYSSKKTPTKMYQNVDNKKMIHF